MSHRRRATPERLTERIFRRGLGRGPVIPGPPPTKSRLQLAAMAAEAIREAAEMDAADIADLCIDTDSQNAVKVAQRIRTRTSGRPRLAPDFGPGQDPRTPVILAAVPVRRPQP